MERGSRGERINRRTFLKGALAGVGSVGLAGWNAAEARTLNLQQVRNWDHTADVVVVGYGAAGGSAAIAAHDAGAKVLILEKMPMGGGNSGVCFGGMAIPESVSEAIDYYRKLNFGTVDEDMLRGFAEAMVGIPRLLSQFGANLRIGKVSSTFPALLSLIPAFKFYPTGQEGFEFLSKQVARRGIRVLSKLSAKNLVQNPETREVVGVKAEAEGKEIYVKAERGVVLCCGGYENNPEMFAYYNYPGLSGFMFPYGTPGNTGDGLKMASAAGAYLWHTAALQWGAFCARKPSQQFGVAIGVGIPWTVKAWNFVFVNKYGQRFMRETKKLGHTKAPLDVLFFNHERAEYPHVPAYLIFDETYRTSGPIQAVVRGPMGYALIHKLYDWSSDNSAEIEKGWIVKADTVADLAGKIKVDRKGLEETISRFNSSCRTGKDLEFNRSRDHMEPVEKRPFYALEMGLALVNTQGGPKHNRYGQVLDPDSQPIPRLYAAGELGSFFGFLYQEGSNYPEAWAFGHIAGKHAASQKPFSA
jgi:succinate dehydrogenase/fumarate reductase flavoprotein subunit